MIRERVGLARRRSVAGAPAIFAATLTAALVAGEAAGAEPRKPPVVVVIERCPGVRLADVQRVVAAELQALLVSEGEGSDAVTRVAIQCESDEVQIAVVDPLTRKQLQRRETLTGSASVRARLIGLSAAELVAASWYELVAEPPARAASAPAPALTPATLAPAALAARDAVQPRLAVATRRAEPWLGGGLFAQVFPRAGHLVLLGGAAGGGVPVGDRWRLDLHAGLARGQTERAGDQVRADVYTATGALALLAVRQPLRLWIDLGGQVGAVQLSGLSSRPERLGTSRWSPLAGPVAGLTAAAGERVGLLGWLRVGWLSLGARGTAPGEQPVDVHGLFLAAGLSVAWSG